MDHLENFKLQIGILVACEIIIIGLLVILNVPLNTILMMMAVIVFNVILVVWTLIRYDREKKRCDLDISRILGSDAKDALLFGEVGILTYDENYVVTWFNDFLLQRGLNLVGQKVTSWHTEINDLFTGDVDEVTIQDENYIYQVTRKEDSFTLYVKDITELSSLKAEYKDERLVLGMMVLDNYMDVSQYEDETTISSMNVSLRQPVLDWAKLNGMVIYRVRTDRFTLVLNEEIYANLLKDKFSILNTIRENAMELGVSVTLSMAFARGKADLLTLDEKAIELIELAQTRGGDQVAVKLEDQDVKYYGGNSEAQEKRSRVRVRVMSKAIKEAISDSNKIFIIGHKNMDFDCMGACLGMSRICSAHHDEVYIVSQSGGIEETCQEALKYYAAALNERHHFITDGEAVRLMKKNDLVIAVDFHNPQHTGAPSTLEKSERTIVIDHHRRSENFVNNPLLVYVETSASSVSELVTEFIPYCSTKLDVGVVEATFMYLGILIDTNHFKSRTGVRTFEAAAELRQLGMDPYEAENLLKENFSEFEIKAEIMKNSQMIREDILVACVHEEKIVSRTLMSQVADQMLMIKGVEASFVIAYSAEKTVAVSARSKGKINVQAIMEAMKGGGHFSAAALQRENATVEEVENELLGVLEETKQKENQNESNHVE